MDKEFPASLDKLYEMLLFIKGSAEEIGFSQRTITSIELAAEEALVNIISYGYPEETGNIRIICNKTDDNKFKVVIEDDGIPYNPLKNRQEVDIDEPIEERGVGGYGVFFILKMMDDVDYHRQENKNILTLVKFPEK